MALAMGWMKRSLLALTLIGVCQAADASSVTLWTGTTGGSLTVDGLIITATACTLKINGVNQGTNPTNSCDNSSLSGLKMQSVAGTGAEVQILGDGTGLNGSAVFNTHTQGPSGTGLYDLTVTLSVAAVSSPTTVSYASLTLAGSATSNSTLISAGESFSGVTGATGLTTNLASPFASTTFTPDSSFSVTKDLAIQAGYANGATLILSSITEIFNPAPEPVSIGIFLVGMGGLAAARRRRRR